MSAACEQCPAGTYQRASGSSACEICSKGSYCPAGSSAPSPCEGGTFLNATGATSSAACDKVEPGYWAPTGSDEPIACPTTGFRCPGYDFDDVNDPPGSLPIEVEQGAFTTQVTETVSTVTQVTQVTS